MTNRELLKAAQETLGPADRQRQFVLQAERTPMPCPACRVPVDALSAAGIDLDAYQFGAVRHEYRCPHCKAGLEQVVPFIAVGPGWHWQIKSAWLQERLAKAELYDREHPEGAP